jgi:hypothetical protein
MPRILPWKAAAIIAGATAYITAPPTPCAARARLSTTGFGASPHSSEARVNPARPQVKIRRRPNWSARVPAPSRKAARVSA